MKKSKLADDARADLFAARDEREREQFSVELSVYSGPFDVLLSLIAKKKLDVTEVALAQVTDDFISYIAQQNEMDLSQASQFLVVAATLLDLKAARLLPHEDLDDDEVMEILEARDLLFAKLLQYKAYKEVAADFALRLASQGLAIPRDVDLEPHFRSAMPDVVINQTLGDFARLMAHVLTRQEPVVTLDHLHDPTVSVESQIAAIEERVAIGRRITFQELCADAHSVPTIVSRFLALLEMLRDGRITISQNEPLAALTLMRIDNTLSSDRHNSHT